MTQTYKIIYKVKHRNFKKKAFNRRWFCFCLPLMVGPRTPNSPISETISRWKSAAQYVLWKQKMATGYTLPALKKYALLIWSHHKNKLDRYVVITDVRFAYVHVCWPWGCGAWVSPGSSHGRSPGSWSLPLSADPRGPKHPASWMTPWLRVTHTHSGYVTATC